MPALAGVAGIDLIVLALIAFVLAVALFPLFRPLLAGALSGLPVVGGWLAQNTDLMLFRAYVSALAWIGQALGPLADLLSRVRWALPLFAEHDVQALENALNAVWRLRFSILPAVADQLAGYALQLYTQAISYANALNRQLGDWTRAALADVTAYAAALYAQAIAYAAALAAQGAAYAQQLYGQALAYAQQLAAQELAYTQASVLQAERYAAQLAAEGIAYTGAAVLGAERYAQRVGLDAEGYAQALQRQALDYTARTAAEVAAGAAAATAVVATAVQAIENSPCQRFCSPLGELGSLLQGLEDAGLAALVLGIIEETRHDPAAVQRVLRDDVTPPLRAALEGLGLAA